MKHLILAPLVLVMTAVTVLAQETLSVPPEMIESGFTKHILPRFKFKHRIVLKPVTGKAPLALTTVATGTRVFDAADGTAYSLTGQGTAHDTFRDWLKSTPGLAAVTSFQIAGQPQYAAPSKKVVVVAPTPVEGDAQLGARLSLVHCGRCHVVDDRNRMGGIGSTPSFAALRGRPGWQDLFLAFWSANPHPSFTQVPGVTEPFGTDRPTHIAPVEITLEEIEAITAFVGGLQAKDLGRPVRSSN
ncbi:hypothetical protein [Actibacterium sp. 188UL27-1]|uniref:hypothetical protein n=1 Tax=Actibacterium sp. 188UL27-1 TaxID=2786961 RepID=UPI0019586FD8|nr:hypothetical protein [Actibacterium sp. 188UL27-1]MBM7066960.1 hypothetical protein [Actibacterium sp. 188UL27-1]